MIANKFHRDIATERLTSLDAFRGLVIFAMLLVNNLGGHRSTGYFWRHAGWIEGTQANSYREWWASLRDDPNPLTTAFSQFPLWRHCTLADYVMPSFMFIIGAAIPLSTAAARSRGIPSNRIWRRVFRRAAMLVVLGWVVCYFRDQFASSLHGERPWTVSLGMDVLQLLGCSYLAARLLFLMPPPSRLITAFVLFLWHYALLRFYPQGGGAGMFTAKSDAIGYIYRTWPIWDWITVHIGPVTIGWRGLLSIPPAVATMLMGSLAGNQLLRRDQDGLKKARHLALYGLAFAAIGFLWAFDLPFNKPRWSPAYLLFVSGLSALLLSTLYTLLDLRLARGWEYPLLVFGMNPIAAYVLPIVAKALLLGTPRIRPNHTTTLVSVRYGTLIMVSALLCLAALRLLLWMRNRIGPAAYAAIAPLLLTLVVLWSRFLITPLVPFMLAPASTGVSLNAAILATVNSSIGPHEGAWVFALAHLVFWWFIIEIQYKNNYIIKI